MIYLKSLLVGVVAAVVTTALWLLAEIALSSLLVARQLAKEAGSGGIGAVSSSYAFPLGTLLGFGVGFFWNVRRLKKKQAVTSTVGP